MKRVTKRVLGSLLIILLSTFALNVKAQSENDSDNDSGEVASDIPKYGSDSVQCVTNLSLYSDYYKQWSNSGYKNHELANTAYKYWRYCFLECPKASQNLYSRGTRLVEFLINEAKDSLISDKYVDTLMMVYDRRIEYFPKNPKYPVGYLRGRQAVDLFQHRKTASDQYYLLFKQSFDLMGNATEPTVLYGYFISSLKYWQDKHSDLDLVYETYIKVNDALQYNINTKSEKDAENYSKVIKNLEPIIIQIATCEKLVSVFEPRFDKNPNDTTLARNLVRLFELRQCTKEDLYYKALKQVHSIAPNAQSAYSMGKMSVERDLLDDAKTYLQQTLSLTSDSQVIKKADTYLLLADVYNKQNNYSKSREAAREVLKLRPDDAFAYLIVGELYVKSASSCTFKDLPVAYWAAADQFAKAAVVAKDDKLRDIAQKQLASIKKNFPIGTDLFMRNLTEGQSFTVECWINETTTVRARKE